MLRIGDRVLHPHNRDLGPGEVISALHGRLSIRFPRHGEVLQFSSEDHPFVPLVLPPGTDPERWWLDYSDDLAERLLRREVDPLAGFANRLESFELQDLREAGDLASYLGGRIRIFPHQLHVAETAFRSDPVRWLLADEVGLGKTIEACLILSRLLRVGHAERVLIVAPATLSVQWLGELYRKFHQVFVLLDRARREDVLRDHGPDFNPFEVHARSVINLEDLIDDPNAARQAAAAKLDLLVIDEAHRLERRPGHPGSPAYRAAAPIVRAATNALLLTATPVEADAHGFFRLLELLWPAEFSSWEVFQQSLDKGVPLYPCTSATRRADIGGLPPRVAEPIDLPGWPEYEAKEAAALLLPAEKPLEKRTREETLQRAHALPTGPEDLRLRWLLEQAKGWKRRREKTLIFVVGRASLDLLKQELEFQLHQRVAVFHEDLSPAQRDLEVAGFAQSDGANLLVSTECGGEGRNFEFCRRLVLFDLPWNPALVEQRIGRLDRINRRRPVEIVYFRPAAGFARQVAKLYERLGVFQEPLGGIERALGHVEQAIRRAADLPEPHLDYDTVLAESAAARERMHRAVYFHLHQNRYRPEIGAEIEARLPSGLEELNERVVIEACRQYGFDVADRVEQRTWYFEFGEMAIVDALHSVPAGSRFLGTFDRETAVQRETIDFFASGHPLVEAVLLELDHGHRGQVALLEIAGTRQRAFGLYVAYKEGTVHRHVAIDLEGRVRAEWLPFVLGEAGRRKDLHPTDFLPPETWPDLVRNALHAARARGKPVAVSGFVLVP